MGTIRELFEAVQSIDLDTEIPRIIESQASDIIALNLGPDQLLGGLTAQGEEISPGYFFQEYSFQKQAQNPLPGLGVPDLKLTGAFYGGFRLIVSKDEYELDSTDEKAFALRYKYGDFIFGLSDKNKSIYSTGKFYDALSGYITAKTGLLFR